MIRGEIPMSTECLENTAPPTKCDLSVTERTPPPGRRPISLRRATDRNRAEAGFMLLEMVCAVAMIALLAAILLPQLSRGTTRPRLEAYAVETAALLKA